MYHLVLNIVFSWSSAADDTSVLAAARNIVSRSNATAYSQGLGYPFLYQNYAALEQPVFLSYGPTNLVKLQTVSKKYDPAGAWQTLQPGYFKVFWVFSCQVVPNNSLNRKDFQKLHFIWTQNPESRSIWILRIHSRPTICSTWLEKVTNIPHGASQSHLTESARRIAAGRRIL